MQRPIGADQPRLGQVRSRNEQSVAGPRSDAADGNAERVICDRGERRSADRASSELRRQQTRDAGVGPGRVDRLGSGASLGPKCQNLGVNARPHSGIPPTQRGVSKWRAASHGGIAPGRTTCTHLKAHYQGPERND